MVPPPVLFPPPPLSHHPMPGRSHRFRVSLGSSVSFSRRLLRSCCNIYFAIIYSAIQSPCGSHFSLFAPLHIVPFTQLAFAQPGVVFWSHRWWLCVLLGSSTPPMRFNLCRTLCVRLVLHYTLAMRCIFYLFCSCFIVQYRCIVTALSIVVCCCRRRRHNHTTIVFAHCVCLHLQSPSGVCRG